jgi:predicted site-specific integrase-resolvase
MNLTTYIPIEKAALRAGVAPEALTRAVQDGKIRAVNVGDNGDVAVSEDDLKVLAIGRDESLEGQPIRVTEASDKYGVSQPNLSNWADYGYIRIIEQAPKLLILDEADVKQAATIFKKAKEVTGSSFKAGWVLKRSMQYLRD